MRPADIVGAISNEAGVPGEAIGDIDIYDEFSFVELPDQWIDIVRGALSRTTIRGQKTRARLADAEDLKPLLDDERPRPKDARAAIRRPEPAAPTYKGARGASKGFAARTDRREHR